jgi:thymidylate synthase
LAKMVQAQNGDEAYLRLIELVKDHGQHVSPRGLPTRELKNVLVEIKEPARAVPLACGRKINMKIAATETLQLLAGISCLEQLDLASNGRFSQFAENGRLLGAYGPRLHQQLINVEKLLRSDHSSRQAVTVIWKRDELDHPNPDMPCTIYLSFLVRNSKLELFAHMRSSDLWLGIPYDWCQFTRLQMVMAHCLGLETGPYIHYADSLHVYDRDWARASMLHGQPPFGSMSPAPFIPGISVPFEVVKHLAENLCMRQEEFRKPALTTMFYEKAVPIVPGVKLCQVCRYASTEECNEHAER